MHPVVEKGISPIFLKSAARSDAARNPLTADDNRRDPLCIAQTARTIDFVEIREGMLPELDDTIGNNCALSFTPFHGVGWLEAWQSLIGQELGSAPFTAIGFSAGEPAFILPLIVTQRYGSRVLTWSAYHQSDYCAPVLNAALAATIEGLDGENIIRDIARRIGGIDLFYVPKQPRSVGGVSNPFLLPGSVPYHVGAHAINFLPGETWEAAYQRRRSAKTRRRLRDKRMALGKTGVISLRTAATELEAQDLIEMCLDAKSRQLKKSGHWDPFARENVRAFIVSYFSREVTHSTWAAALEVGGKSSAVAFGFRNSREWLLYQMAMTSELEARHSPGTHLLMELMNKCSQLGVKRLDLGLGDEPYKAEWCDEHVVLETSTLAFTARGRLLQKMIRLRAAARSRIANKPELYERAKWLKRIARKFWLPF